MNSIARLDPAVAAAIYGRFRALNPAQEAAIEPLLAGRDMVLASGTGSGKTEAALAPLLSKFWRQAIADDTLFLLYIAPTKALVNDIAQRLARPLDALGLRVGIRHGDHDDLASAKHPHVLITTPESLDVLLFRRDDTLQVLKAVIIDEVHLLYNTQRGLQLSILLRRLKHRIQHQFQWVALSATVSNLADVRTFLFGPAEEATFLQYPSQRSINARIRHIASDTDFLTVIRHLCTGRPTKLLVFANTRRACERLASILARDPALHAIAITHYSSLSAEVRREAESRFASARTAICIATSTLELGIDIGDIDAVVLWGTPPTVEAFLQRIGRGNRRANKTSAICLIPDDSPHVLHDVLRFLVLLDASRKGELPRRKPFELFGAVAQQCLGIIASEGGTFTRVADLHADVGVRAHVDRSTLDMILSELASQGYVQPHGFKHRYGAASQLYRLVDLRLIYGNYALSSQMVNVFHGAKVLGAVPVTNLLHIRQGMFVRFAGRCWRVGEATVTSIKLESVSPRPNPIDFKYAGTGQPLDAFIADRMWQGIHTDELPIDALTTRLQTAFLRARDDLRAYCSYQHVPYVQTDHGIRYLTYGGYLVNKAVALITDQHEYEVDGISLQVSTPITWASVPVDPHAYESIFDQLFEVTAEQSLYQTLLPRDLQRSEFLQDWLQDERIPYVLARLAQSIPMPIPLDKHGFLGP